MEKRLCTWPMSSITLVSDKKTMLELRQMIASSLQFSHIPFENYKEIDRLALECFVHGKVEIARRHTEWAELCSDWLREKRIKHELRRVEK